MAKQVVLYTTPTCPWCTKAKAYLEEKNLKFAEYNVASNPDKYMEMVNQSGQSGVPVITVGDEVVVGFNKPLLEELLSD